MARVTLTRDEYTSGELPPVCVVCGEYTERKQSHEFGASPLAVILWGLSAPWVIFIAPPMFSYLLVIAAEWFRSDLPVCRAHREHWRARSLLYWAMFLGSWASIPCVLFVDDRSLAMISTAIGWAFTTSLFVYTRLSEVRAVLFDAKSITLVGVHPEFVAAVERMREEPDAWPESR